MCHTEVSSSCITLGWGAGQTIKARHAEVGGRPAQLDAASHAQPLHQRLAGHIHVEGGLWVWGVRVGMFS